ncbi:hypothetical protein N2152v2_005547 [Parachlorella kessleri]
MGGRKAWRSPARRVQLLPQTNYDAGKAGAVGSRAAAGAGSGGRRLWRSSFGSGFLARSLLWRALAALTAVMLALHLTSGGFVTVGLVPLAGSSGAAAQLEDLVQLSGDGDPAAAARRYISETDSAPKLIPRIIHQTYKTRQVPERVAQYMGTWQRMNPGWDVRFYDDHDCLDFVRREFPEYLEAYRALAKDVERSDFFRYMVVLRAGGVYADIDTECKQPLDTIIRSRDTLIVGWESEFPDAQKALDAWHVRTRQLLQWAFAAAPEHPALKELCDRIAGSQHRAFSPDTHLDTLERTGPGLFTDTVLKHADLHAPNKRDDPWTVRILPRVQLGVPNSPAYGLSPSDPSVVVLHHALASWRIQRRWFWRFWQRTTVEDTSKQLTRSWNWHSEDAKRQQISKMQKIDAVARLYPVSTVFDPPFDIFTHLVGRGERQSGGDVSSALTTHGSWQPSVQPSRRPSLADALVGSLGIASNAVLLDIGAGYGFFSLAAAARGHKVHAFELAPASLEAFEASIEYNGFKHLIEVHKLPLGAPDQEEYICIVPRQKDNVKTSRLGSDPETASIDMLRGYSTPQAHQTAAMDCQLMAKRTPGASVVGEEESVGAIRVSANGWEGFIMRGFEPLLHRSQAPPVIALEWNPAAMRLVGFNDPLEMVQRLYDLGWTDISHSGYVCDERWYSVTYGVRRRGGMKPEDLSALKQPTWCRLLPEQFGLLLERASSTYPETLLFINKKAGLAFNATAAGGRKGTSLRSGASDREADSAAEQVAGSGRGWSGMLHLFSRHPQADLSNASEKALGDEKVQQQQQLSSGRPPPPQQPVDPPQLSLSGQPASRGGSGELEASKRVERQAAAASRSDDLARGAAGGVEQLEGAATALQQRGESESTRQ